MLPVPLCVDPPSVTDHVVPDGNPDSVKVTGYVEGELTGVLLA